MKNIQCSPIAAWVLEFLLRAKGAAYMERIIAGTEEDVFVEFLDDAASISTRFEWRDTTKHADCHLFGPRGRNAIPTYYLTDSKLEMREPEAAYRANLGLLESDRLGLARLMEAPGIPDLPIAKVRRRGGETDYMFDIFPTRALPDILRDLQVRADAGELTKKEAGR